MPWLTGWTYRRKLTIQGVNGAGLHYSVLIKIGENPGALNYDFHLSGHSDNFPSGTNQSGDLRFTDINGTLLPFYVERILGTEPNRTAYCFVKIPYPLDDDVDIYCYYGNANASNVSNGRATFPIFEDMSIPPAGYLSYSATYDGTNQWVQLTPAVNGDMGFLYYYMADLPITNGFEAQFEHWAGGGSGADLICFLAFVSSVYGWYGATNNGYNYVFSEYTGSIRIYFNSSLLATYSVSNLGNQQWHQSRIKYFNYSHKVYYDGIPVISYQDTTRTFGNLYFAWGGHTGGLNNIHRIRNLLVRKYIEPEPYVKTVFTEEHITYNVQGHLFDKTGESINGIVCKVFALNRDTGDLLGTALSNTDGSFSIDVAANYGDKILLVASYEGNYQGDIDIAGAWFDTIE